MENIMKIVVLCGGLSTERNISLISGTKICGALRSRGHQAVLVDLYLGLEDMEEEFQADPAKLFEELPPLKPVVFDGQTPDLEAVKASRKLKSKALFGTGVLKICQAADVVFMGLHGMNGEDGRVQATFEVLGIPFTGSGYLGAGMTMDKLITKQLVNNELRAIGCHVPEWRSYHDVREEQIPRIIEKVKTKVPCVVKTPTGGSSVGVVIVREESEVEGAVRECLRYGNDLLIEQFIEGREFTCAVLRDRALPSVEIAPKTRFYDYSNKYVAGATEEICPGRCTPEVEKLMGEAALLVHKYMKLATYSRCDFIIDAKDQVWFLEINTLPGMTPTSLVPQEAAAVGISYEELCEIIAQDGIRMNRW